MTPRIICPHCHSPIDPLTLEMAFSAEAQYRICPECDEPIVLLVNGEDESSAPSEDARPPESDSTHALRGEIFSDQERMWV